MALGAVESVYAAGKGEQVTIIGVDGNSDAVKSIKDGRLNASVAQLPYLVGKQAVENVKKALAGEQGAGRHRRAHPGADQGGARCRQGADAAICEIASALNRPAAGGSMPPPAFRQRRGRPPCPWKPRNPAFGHVPRGTPSSACMCGWNRFVRAAACSARSWRSCRPSSCRSAISSTSCSPPRRSACWRSRPPSSSARAASTCRSAR